MKDAEFFKKKKLGLILFHAVLVLRNTFQIHNPRTDICGNYFQLDLSEVTGIKSEINPLSGHGNNPELWLADTAADFLAFPYINFCRHDTFLSGWSLSYDVSADISYESMGCITFILKISHQIVQTAHRPASRKTIRTSHQGMHQTGVHTA